MEEKEEKQPEGVVSIAAALEPSLANSINNDVGNLCYFISKFPTYFYNLNNLKTQIQILKTVHKRLLFLLPCPWRRAAILTVEDCLRSRGSDIDLSSFQWPAACFSFVRPTVLDICLFLLSQTLHPSLHDYYFLVKVQRAIAYDEEHYKLKISNALKNFDYMETADWITPKNRVLLNTALDYYCQNSKIILKKSKDKKQWCKTIDLLQTRYYHQCGLLLNEAADLDSDLAVPAEMSRYKTVHHRPRWRFALPPALLAQIASFLTVKKANEFALVLHCSPVVTQNILKSAFKNGSPVLRTTTLMDITAIESPSLRHCVSDVKNLRLFFNGCQSTTPSGPNNKCLSLTAATVFANILRPNTQIQTLQTQDGESGMHFIFVSEQIEFLTGLSPFAKQLKTVYLPSRYDYVADNVLNWRLDNLRTVIMGEPRSFTGTCNSVIKLRDMTKSVPWRFLTTGRAPLFGAATTVLKQCQAIWFQNPDAAYNRLSSLTLMNSPCVDKLLFLAIDCPTSLRFLTLDTLPILNSLNYLKVNVSISRFGPYSNNYVVSYLTFVDHKTAGINVSQHHHPETVDTVVSFLNRCFSILKLQVLDLSCAESSDASWLETFVSSPEIIAAYGRLVCYRHGRNIQICKHANSVRLPLNFQFPEPLDDLEPLLEFFRSYGVQV